ncbi:sulfate reduction electron transfer complex DsrMKJOP subunit DsrO [Bacteroidota bacterium]
MKINRRKFLSIAGVAAALGIAGKPTYNILASETAVPEPGQKRLAMAINFRKLMENPHVMDNCIEACHKAHNVPNIKDTKQEVKWIWKEPYHHAFLEQDNYQLPENIVDHPVLLLCNHCDNPPCVSVCPTQATWRRAEDGIVMMDWHRCIGCRYCMAACPYGSRSFNWKDPRPDIDEITSEFPTRMKGVVEKCTFCDERLVQGKKPACVEACCHGEIIFGDLNDPESEIREVLSKSYSIRRKPELGTQPEVYYLV